MDRPPVIEGSPYRGRDGRLGPAAPPSEPYERISRIRLSSQWFYLEEDCLAATRAALMENNPCAEKKSFGQR